MADASNKLLTVADRASLPESSELLEEIDVAATADDPNEANKVAKIELFEDGEVIDTNEPPAPGKAEWQVKRKPTPGKHFLFTKVTQVDGEQLWSAPVWVTVAAPVG